MSPYPWSSVSMMTILGFSAALLLEEAFAVSDDFEFEPLQADNPATAKHKTDKTYCKLSFLYFEAKGQRLVFQTFRQGDSHFAALAGVLHALAVL